jgi:ubiquitin-protein ligase
VVQLQSSALGVSMAEGWKYRVVLEGPAFSPYDLGLITVELELDEDWPDTVPFVRFTSIVYHSQCVTPQVPMCRCHGA